MTRLLLDLCEPNDPSGHAMPARGRSPKFRRLAKPLTRVSAGALLVREPLEGLVSRSRAADDFATIRARLEELRRERVSEQPAPKTDTSVVYHRGPCACGRSLFRDECDGSCKAL